MGRRQRPWATTAALGVVTYCVVLACATTVTGYYLPAGLAVLVTVVLWLALSTMAVLVLTLEAGMASRPAPPQEFVSMAVGLTAIVTIGGCALGATLA